MTLKFMAYSELMESANNRLNDGLKNGIHTSKHLLTFKKSNLTINIHSKAPYKSNLYEIDLEKIVDSSSLLGWITHLHGKRWEGDNEIIHTFLTLLSYAIELHFKEHVSLDDFANRGAVLNWKAKIVKYPNN